VDSAIASARQAFSRHDWPAAHDAFVSADGEGALETADLRMFADAAWWSGKPDLAVETLERAFAEYSTAGDRTSAAIIALQLAYLAVRRMAGAVAYGWMASAEQLLEGEPEGSGHAWLSMMHTAKALFVGNDYPAAIEQGERAVALGRRHGVPDVTARALGLLGSAHIAMGAWEEGLALIDEATAAIATGVLDPRSACDVYCNTIACCAILGDFQRAGQWTEEATRWMERRSLGGYPGQCRVHRAEVMRMRGQYPEAEREARAAGDQLEGYRMLDVVGAAQYEVGQVRLRMGDLEGASAAFDRAYEYGHHAQPGLALLQLANGDVTGAVESLRSHLAPSNDGDAALNLDRAWMLPAAVEIAIAAGDHDWARSATEELERFATRLKRPVFEAGALTARGRLLLALGNPAEAIGSLDRAWRLWRDHDLPYESAQARLLVGQARRAVGDESSAVRDLNAAHSEFQRLGAAGDAEMAQALLGSARTAPQPAEQVVRTFMFTDIVGSTELIGLIGDAAWEDLLRVHDRVLRHEFEKRGGIEAKHTGDGFMVSFERPLEAVESAVGIQRALAEHRRTNGFAPWVRIGLHTAEATPQGRDFAGGGVHLAARVGAIGEREEIVASTDTLAAAGTIRYSVSDARTVALKGIKGPVEVRSILWA
jgi:class 3 adenylate cyclase